MDYQAFWVFNYREFEGVDGRREIERQLGEFAARGMSCVVLHLRFGHQIPYLSETWAALAGHILATAARLGLKIIVWEDDAWPPGFVGGRLTRERPELRAHNMMLGSRKAPAAETLVWDLGECPVLAARAVAEDGAALDLLPHVGTHATQWSVFKARHLYVGGDREGDQVEYSRANQGEVHYFLSWTAPVGQGDWTVHVLQRLEPVFKYSGYLLDSLSAEATRARIALNYDWYHQRFAGYFGSTLAGFYCAEPPQNNWTPALFVRFRARYGYGLEETFPLLGAAAGERAEQVRMDYKRLLADLFAEHYVAPVRQWCDERGVAFWARLEGDESVVAQSELRGGLYPAVRRFSVPVFDLVNGAQFGDAAHPRLNTGINFCNSIARQQGGSTLFEGVGPVGWSMRLAGPEAQFNWAVVMGSESLQSENLFYSIDGYRKDDCPPSQSYQNPYWRVFGAWRDQYARLAAALQGARPVQAEVCLILPISAMNACRPAVPLAEAAPADERAARIEDSFQSLHQKLIEACIPVDIVDERALESAVATSMGLQVGQASYRVAILPFAPRLDPAAGKVLDAFVAAGGQVLRDPAPEAARAELSGQAPAGVPEGCYARSFRAGETKLLLVFNPTCDPVPAAAMAGRYERVPLQPHEWDDTPLEPGSLTLWREGVKRELVLAPRRVLLEVPASAWRVELPVNALVLDSWNLKVIGTGTLDAAQPVPAAFGISLCKPAPLFQQVELRGHEHRRYGPGYQQAPDGYRPIVGSTPFPLRVAYRCHFIPSQEVLASLRLLMESEAVQGAWRMFINRRLIARDEFESARSYDVGNRQLHLARHLVPGVANWIEIQVQADRLEDGLLEPLRIMGEFELERHPNGPRLLARRAAAGLGDWAGYGHPETAGWAVYRTTVKTPAPVREIDLGVVHEIATVFVDEKLAGHVFKPPYRVRLAELAAGEHTVRIEVANGLGNLLERLGNPAGLYGPVTLW